MQMRLGFIGENSLDDVERDCQFAREYGFDGIEYNYWAKFTDLDGDTVAKMRAIHRAYGLRVSMLGIWGWNHLSRDPEERKRAHEMLGRAISFAEKLGADVVATGGGDIPDEPLERKVEEFLQVFPPFLARARDAGLTPVFYARHGSSFFDSIRSYEAVWEHLPEVRIKYDPTAWMRDGDYLQVVQQHGDRVGHVHVKEVLHRDGVFASQPAAGMGDIAWGKIMAFLYEHDYRGWISLEPHGPIWSRGEMRWKMLRLSKQHLSQFLV